MTLKTKLSLILIPLVVIPIILLGKFSYEHLVTTIRKTAVGPMEVLLNQVHQEMQFHLDTAQATITHLSKSNRIKYLFIESKVDRDSILQVQQDPLSLLFTSYMDVYPEYYDIRVLLPDGYEVMRFFRNQDKKIQMAKEDKTAYFSQIQNSRGVLSLPKDNPDIDILFITDSNNQEPAFVIIKKMFFDNFSDALVGTGTKLHGYLLITMHPSFLAEHVTLGKISDNGYLLVTDGQGRVLYHPHQLAINTMPPSQFQQWRTHTSDSKLFQTEFDNQLVYVQGKQLHDNLYLFALLPEKDVLAAGQWLRTLFAIAILVSTVVTLILLFFALNYLVIKPVQILAIASREIGAGNLDIQLPARPEDEIGALYFCFNQMVKRLRSALTQIEGVNADLEEKVRLRTLSLEQLNRELEVERQKADAANLAKSEFIANISHELRTPLNGILGMTELILGTSLNDKQARQLHLVYDSGEMLLTLINDLLDVSKFEAGKMKLDIGPFDLLQAFEDAITLLRPKATEKDLRLELQTSQAIPKHLLGDKNRLRQIVLNLVGNAIKFTEHGSVTVHIMLEKCQEGYAHVKVTVTDTGIGIPKDELPNLFNKFHQVDTSASRKYGGTGLGLFICHQLVSVMRGKIGVDTEVGKGCTFWFTLALPIVELSSTPALTTLPEAGSISDLSTMPALELPRAHILLVEDDKINQMVAQMMLEELGCQISIANHGQEAIDMTANQHYDLVFMDIHMPVLDGYAATRHIRQREQEIGGRSLIIAMTANALASDREKCLAEGMDDVLIKPVSKAALAEMLKKWLGTKFQIKGKAPRN